MFENLLGECVRDVDVCALECVFILHVAVGNVVVAFGIAIECGVVAGCFPAVCQHSFVQIVVEIHVLDFGGVSVIVFLSSQAQREAGVYGEIFPYEICIKAPVEFWHSITADHLLRYVVMIALGAVFIYVNDLSSAGVDTGGAHGVNRVRALAFWVHEVHSRVLSLRQFLQALLNGVGQL